MSFVHKLESLYGNFIRLLAALLTLTLLAVAVMALLNWQRATASEEPRKAVVEAAPRVSNAELVTRVVASQSGQSVDPIRSNDPNRAAYERIDKAIKAFAQKHPSDEDLDAGSLLSLAQENVGEQDSAGLKAAYASGLAAALEQTLSDAKIDALLQPSKSEVKFGSSDEVTPMGIVHETINQYDSDFTEQLAMLASHDDDGAARQKRSDAWLSLARVGGPLLLLLLVLQLLTFGRIEQNTRRGAKL